MIILITGAYGLIGHHLLNSIPKEHTIIAVSRSYRKNSSKKKNILNHTLNWDNTDDIIALLKGVDVVIHAAGIDAKLSTVSPDQAMKFNAYTTKTLVNAAVKNKIKKFIYFSTVHVYKSNLTGYITENTKLNNTHPYAASKKLGEEYILNSINLKSTKLIILRLSNIISPPIIFDGNGWDLVFNDFCKQAIKNKKIEIKNNISILRDYISINVLSELINHIIKYTKTINQSIFNVSSGDSKTLLEVAEAVKKSCEKLYNFSPDIKFYNEKNKKKFKLKIVSENLKELKFSINSNFEKSLERNLKFIYTNHKNKLLKN